ncbi:DUF1992 domain-containing protein [Psychromarinibacter sp. C21-152]|uniref:DUF1992 domain-containing protein n=1 Tax=Psychromarinibacter sediminicola TaxID=3033385 RepID=A0AAE3NQ06_9RHOB|nr:DUF1992 domain-containing protein [Psychromarinibacter sediminicola]MDF0599937.1 DUF1992 domain-containing protein [Psychromarinibacter sediminicola]
MTRRFRNLTEQQIRKAEAEGKLTNLAGASKPLPDRPGDAFISPGDAVGHRIMAEAGALPEEILLKRKVAVAREAVRTAKPEARKAAMAHLAELDMRLAIAQEARRKFLKE